MTYEPTRTLFRPDDGCVVNQQWAVSAGVPDGWFDDERAAYVAAGIEWDGGYAGSAVVGRKAPAPIGELITTPSPMVQRDDETGRQQPPKRRGRPPKVRTP